MSQNPRLTNNQTTTKTSLEATVNNTTTKAYYTIEDQLEVYGQNTYRYDDDGYLQEKTTPDGTTTYSYGTLGELQQVTTPTSTGSVTVVSYQHNANNQRVAKLINNQVVEKYLWADLTTLLAIYDSNDNLVQRFEYVNDRMPVSMTDSNGTKYYLHYDQVGSLKAVSDVNGNIVKESTYDTFGKLLNDTNPSLKVPFGFAGGLYDEDTELTRFGYRDYDAYTGKWTAKDPIGFSGGDSNLYGYVLGDPVDFVDPRGEFAWFVGFALGGLAEVAIQLWNNGGDYKCIDWEDVLIGAGFGAFAPGLVATSKKIKDNFSRSYKAYNKLGRSKKKTRPDRRLKDKIKNNISDAAKTAALYEALRRTKGFIQDETGCKNPCKQ